MMTRRLKADVLDQLPPKRCTPPPLPYGMLAASYDILLTP